MSTAKKVLLPSQEDIEQAKVSSRALSRYTDAERVHLAIKASNSQTEDVVLPGHVMQLLIDLLSEMAKGNAISLIPHHQELSTQEAAHLLNVSRPFLIQLLNEDAIPYRKVGTHRRVRLTDVLRYREQSKQQRHEALDELTALSQESGN